jgi:Tol biopolymer transport system component
MRRIVGCLLLAAAALTAQTAQELFQQGLVKERSEGKLNDAIQLYQKAAESAGKDRALAAKALLQAGECYQKLGNSEARKLFERVVNDYTDQKPAVATARARLDTLAPAPRPGGMSTRQVWADALDNEGAPSPDGRYLSFVDWVTGDLAIRDLAAGKNRRLTNKGPWDSSDEFALFSVFSPDGKQLAYAWFNGERENAWDIRTVSIVDGALTSKPRVLYAGKDFEYVIPADWSKDGKSILALFSSRDLTHKIGLISVADGSTKILKTLDWRTPSKLSLSPDGRYIAYDFPPREDFPQRDIYVLATDGSRESTVVEHPANDTAPIWTPDGGKLLFTSTRSGSAGEWIVALSGGKAQGAPDLVKSDIGQMEPMGFTRAGALYYSVHLGDSDVYTAQLQPASGEPITPVKRLTERFTGLNRGADWSPDGRLLAYVSTRSFSIREPGATVICVRTLDSGEQRELRPELSYFQNLRWAPDGKSITTWGSDRKGRKGIYQVDAQTGHVTPLVSDADDPRNMVWSPDGKFLYYAYFRDGRVVRRDIATGQVQVVLPPGRAARRFTLSPDGSQIAMFIAHPETKSQAIVVMPASGGAPRQIYPPAVAPDAPLPQFNMLEWTPDGKHLLLARAQSSGTELWKLPAQGGIPEMFTSLPMSNVRDIRFKADGRQISFNAGGSKADIWEMDGFLPTISAKK